MQSLESSLIFEQVFIFLSECGTVFPEEDRGVQHILQKFNNYLPPYMRARCGLWSLSIRTDWVWVVPDYTAGLAVGTKDSNSRERNAQKTAAAKSPSKTANGDQVKIRCDLC